MAITPRPYDITDGQKQQLGTVQYTQEQRQVAAAIREDSPTETHAHRDTSLYRERERERDRECRSTNQQTVQAAHTVQ